MSIKESSFQFTNPALVGLELILNPEFDSSQAREIEMPVHLSINCAEEGNNEAIVTLSCEIGTKDDSTPFWIKAIENARFRWDMGFPRETVDELLQQNAPALLLSYLRPVINQVTCASPYGGYNIPFMNFTEK